MKGGKWVEGREGKREGGKREGQGGRREGTGAPGSNISASWAVTEMRTPGGAAGACRIKDERSG